MVFKLRHYFRLSETDELTSIPNYRSFRRKIRKEILAHKQNKSPLSLAILDINHFRRFNYHSYAFGDMVLKDFVGFIKTELPCDAFIARFRLGDEFIIILNSTTYDATATIERILNKSSNISRFNHEFNMNYYLTFSFGISGFVSKIDTADSLLERTEKALKGNKRNTEN